jgi:hypothetical protein
MERNQEIKGPSTTSALTNLTPPGLKDTTKYSIFAFPSDAEINRMLK